MALDQGPGGGVGDTTTGSATETDSDDQDDELESSLDGGVSAGPGSDAPTTRPENDDTGSDGADSSAGTGSDSTTDDADTSGGGGVTPGPGSGESPVDPQGDDSAQADQQAEPADAESSEVASDAELLDDQFSQGAQEADVEQVSEDAYRVETDATAGSGASPGPGASSTQYVATSEQGLRSLESMQARRSQYAEVARESASIARESEVIDVREDAERRAREERQQFQRGNVGDPEEIVAESVAEQAGEDVSADDVRVQMMDGETRVQVRGQPREQIVSQLESQIAEDGPEVDLTQSDVSFEETQEDGQTQIRGELTEDAQKRVRQESAPGQGTPLEDVFEAGAGLQFEYEQSTEGVEQTFNKYTPDTPSSEDIIGAATAAAPVAAAEPTPAGEVVVGGALAVGGAVAAAEGLSRVSQASGVTATTVNIPDDSTGQFQDELEVSGNANQFESELEVPERSEQMAGPFGVPEQGITIDPEQNVAPWQTDPEEVPVEGGGVFTSEVDIPDDTDASGDVLQTQPQQAFDRAQRRGRRQGRRESGSSVGSGQSTSREVPERFIPDEEVTIGETGDEGVGSGFPSVPARDSPGLVIGSGSGVGFVGREARPERTLTRGEDAFLAVDLAEPFESTSIRESAQQASVGGDAQATTTAAGADPLSGTTSRTDTSTSTTTGQPLDVDVGVDTATDTATGQATTSATANVTGPATETPNVNVPEYGSPTVNAPQYEFQAPTAGEGQQRPRSRPPIPDLPESDGPDDGPEFELDTRTGELLTEFVDPLTGDRDSSSDDNAESSTLGFLG